MNIQTNDLSFLILNWIIYSIVLRKLESVLGS